MIDEIIEAIHLMYEDDPELEVDCYLYLLKINNNNKDLIQQIKYSVKSQLNEMGRCCYCGSIMKIHRYQEPHPELDGCPMEDMTELYCPNCNKGGYND